LECSRISHALKDGWLAESKHLPSSDYIRPQFLFKNQSFRKLKKEADSEKGLQASETEETCKSIEVQQQRLQQRVHQQQDQQQRLQHVNNKVNNVGNNNGNDRNDNDSKDSGSNDSQQRQPTTTAKNNFNNRNRTTTIICTI
jgi:hypothetical protein